MTIPAIVLCRLPFADCHCLLEKGHRGPHKCECGGMYYGEGPDIGFGSDRTPVRFGKAGGWEIIPRVHWANQAAIYGEPDFGEQS